jgi:hypothetical protein
LQRILFAIRSFFAILFTGSLPADIAEAYGFKKPVAAPPPPRPVPVLKPSDGALQILGILQRDARLVDFFMEDIAAYTDDQVGAAVRNLHEQARGVLQRYVTLAPVIDGVEGTYTKIEKSDPTAVKLLGNVPASGKAPGGTLRHKGWRASGVNLPALAASQNVSIIAPAEIEVE